MGRSGRAGDEDRKQLPSGGLPSGDIHGVQGEGNREADRRYREGARRFAESGRVEEAAREARESVEDGDDADGGSGPGFGEAGREPDAEGSR